MLASEREASLRPRCLWLLVAGVVVALALPVFVIQFRVRHEGRDYYLRLNPLYFCSPGDVSFDATSGPYRVRCYVDRRRWFDGSRFQDARVDILRDGKVVWRVEDRYATMGSFSGKGASDLPGIVDLDKDGTPEMICEVSPGGNGGYSFTRIISLGEQLEDMNPSAADATDDSAKDFEDLDGDGIPEAIGHDKSFQFFNVCHASSPYPRVISRFRDRRLVVAPDLMRRLGPELSAAELESEKQQCKEAKRLGTGVTNGLEADAFYATLLKVMLDLIYAGRSREAFAFLDEVWPEQSARKRVFVAELDDRANRSPYIGALRKLGYRSPVSGE